MKHVITLELVFSMNNYDDAVKAQYAFVNMADGNNAGGVDEKGFSIIGNETEQWFTNEMHYAEVYSRDTIRVKCIVG